MRFFNKVMNPSLMIVDLVQKMQKHREKGNNLFVTLLWIKIQRKFGCVISPKAQIADSCAFPHPVGIVIGDGVVVGDDCIIYQNVTLGERHGGYPFLGRGAIIYPGSVVAGNISIGDSAVIGANSTVLHDVPEGGIAVGSPARVIIHCSIDS